MRQAFEELVEQNYFEIPSPLIQQDDLGNINQQHLSYLSFIRVIDGQIAVPISVSHYIIPTISNQQEAMKIGDPEREAQQLTIIQRYELLDFGIAVVKAQIEQKNHRYFGMNRSNKLKDYQLSEKFDCGLIKHEFENLNYLQSVFFTRFQILSKSTQAKTSIYISQPIINHINNLVYNFQSTLKLNNQNVGEQEINMLKSMKRNLSEIDHLSLWWNNLGVPGLNALMGCDLSRLRSLDLRKNYIRQEGFNLFVKKQWTVLRVLKLSDNLLVNMDCAKSIVFPVVKDLDLQNNSLTYSIFYRFASLYHLTTLNLNSNKIMHSKNSCSLKIVSLKQLYLASNQIRSLELLTRAYFPSLQFLSLYNNYICNFTQNLKKAFIPRVKEIWLEKNLCVELDIHQSFIKQLRIIRVEFNTNDFRQTQDLRWIVKSSSLFSIQKVFAFSNKRLKSSKRTSVYLKSNINPNIDIVLA